MPSDTLVRALLATGTAVLLLLVFHALQRILSRAHTLAEDMRGTNTAYQLVHAGHILAVLLLVPGIVLEALTHPSLAGACLWAAAFTVAGVVLIQLVGGFGIKLLMRSTLEAELQRGNVAAGAAGAANYVAVGILASRALVGSDLRGFGLAIAFFALAVVTLALFVALFRALTTYDDAEQIQRENLAAAVSYAGLTVSVALQLARALTGDFESWGVSLAGYAWVAAAALALYPVRQVLVQGLILGHAPSLRGGALDHEIGTDRNVGMAVMESLAYIATAVAIAGLT